MKKTFIYGLFGLLTCLFSLSLVSCGDDDDDGGSGSGSLIGTWEASMTHNGQLFMRTLKVDKTTWTLSSVSEYEDGYIGGTRIGGTYTVSSNVITAVSTISEYTNEAGEWVSQRNPKTTTYTWYYKIKGNQLTITQDDYTETYTRK